MVFDRIREYWDGITVCRSAARVDTNPICGCRDTAQVDTNPICDCWDTARRVPTARRAPATTKTHIPAKTRAPVKTGSTSYHTVSYRIILQIPSVC